MIARGAQAKAARTGGTPTERVARGAERSGGRDARKVERPRDGTPEQAERPRGTGRRQKPPERTADEPGKRSPAGTRRTESRVQCTRLSFSFGCRRTPPRLRRFAFGCGVLLSAAAFCFRLRRFAAASAFCFGSVPCPALSPLSRGRGGRGRLPVPPGRCGRRWRSLPPPQSGAPRGRPCPIAWPR